MDQTRTDIGIEKITTLKLTKRRLVFSLLTQVEKQNMNNANTLNFMIIPVICEMKFSAELKNVLG